MRGFISLSPQGVSLIRGSRCNLATLSLLPEGAAWIVTQDTALIPSRNATFSLTEATTLNPPQGAALVLSRNTALMLTQITLIPTCNANFFSTQSVSFMLTFTPTQGAVVITPQDPRLMRSLERGQEMVALGYCLYGSSCCLVLTDFIIDARCSFDPAARCMLAAEGAGDGGIGLLSVRLLLLPGSHPRCRPRRQLLHLGPLTRRVHSHHAQGTRIADVQSDAWISGFSLVLKSASHFRRRNSCCCVEHTTGFKRLSHG